MFSKAAALLFMLLLTDSMSIIRFSIITLNIKLMKCTCIRIYRYKSFYIGIVIVSFILIYWYIIDILLIVGNMFDCTR